MATRSKKSSSRKTRATEATLVERKAISIHIGAAVLSRYTYGEPPIIGSCETDAFEMSGLAWMAGFRSSNGSFPDREILLNSKATIEAVTTRLQSAKEQLINKGDALLLTFSGHGATFHVNGEALQAWCLYDKPMLETDLGNALGDFAEGVEILIVSDSCDSGGIAKRVNARAAGENPTSAPGPLVSTERANEMGLGAVKRLLGGVTISAGAPSFPEISAFTSLLGKVEKRPWTFDAHVVFISACGDNQDTHGGATPNEPSVFTANLLRVWNNGNFNGTFAKFEALLRINSPAGIPEYYAADVQNQEFLDRGPFKIKRP